MKKYDELASSIIDLVGGKENVQSLTHCVTRLRFVLKDETKADDSGVKHLNGVVTLVKSGGQYQIVIGSAVADVYETIADQISLVNQQDHETSKKMSLLDRLMNTISQIFQPILGILCAAGMLKGFNSLFSTLGLYAMESGTYTMINAFGDALFMFLPIYIGYTSAKRFDVKPFIGLTIGAILCYPAIQLSTISAINEPIYTFFSGTSYEMTSYLDLFGIPLIAMDYTFTVMPVILIVYFASKVQKLLEKVIPKLLRFMLVPMLTIFVSMTVGFLIIGPIITSASSIVSQMMQAIAAFSPVVYGFVYGGSALMLVIFGLHWGMIPLWIYNIGVLGYDNLLVVAFTNCFGALGVMLAIYLKTNDKKLKAMSIPAMISAIFGITEPALYGILLPLKKTFAIACITNGIAGAVIAFMGLKEYIAGGIGVFEFASFINPMNGDASGMYGAIFASLLAIIIGFVLTFFIYDDCDEQNATPQEEEKALTVNKEIGAPLKGTIVQLTEVEDSAFSSGALGKGVAVVPEEGVVYAPVDGEIISLFPTCHAVGIKGESGEEILIHIGMDTVNLEESYFTSFIKQGDKVHKGQMLIKFNLAKIKESGYDVTSPIVITNSDDFFDIIESLNKKVQIGDTILTLIAEVIK